MRWKFDQAPDVACVTCRSVLAGHPVLVATHHEDDHSWAFTDGAPIDMPKVLVVAMAEVVERHTDLDEIADLPPGWSATRGSANGPWSRQQND
ncbi:hypothetical protein IB277_07755 [Ensifer sp. ENS07]|jgi:hypothetical protein|uniref:Uncharacterized protein n=1 Tax=Ensifer adhaerens TaxID=106592 RepID=A0A9Q8YB59_ENSAD|nr:MULTISPECIES: hypothetical protein [Ensifer]MBD9591296.1 hypothetical protein [Ensifer sp. ENS05]MBD9636190.1 hypothetical protein [Ensifer sp. ENS07]USJ24905.1 hypothetical protein NE863_08055 [Ensifer adhaerens]UTV38286.1 hypothetical protein MYG64_08335 [Ensifer adhaerens]SDL13984.1 hypothetical protein SAMN05216328_10185 [Ensifer sp. YR511]